ncbi:alpha/beta hydrolase [Sphingomonas sp.]|uniref:alpha/beta hydrolase n=1 Tax=Sphingomonas sp. TaxID=28214 RepID=UPI0035C8721D
MLVGRRSILGAAAALPLLNLATAANAAPVTGGETLALWPNDPPGAPSQLPKAKIADQSKRAGFTDRWVSGIARPSLMVRRAAAPNGTAVLLVPGGGYGFLAIDNEGEEQARWLNAIGVTCFILSCRLPGEGWSDRARVPLQDAQRAMRVIRSRASSYGVDAARVAVLGFSAGGHLAGSLATRFAEQSYARVDAADQLSARPDMAGLVYPVVSMAAPFTHAGSRDNLLGTDADQASRRRASVELHVAETTPPMFLAHASDDDLVPIANSLALYRAMLDQHRAVEFHGFDQGGHGFGTRLPKTVPASAWPTLFAAFARRLDLLPG